MKKLIVLAMIFAALWQAAVAQDYSKDTVWTKKTDQMDGFYMVKFSNTDSLIVGHGYEMDIFYDAKTGQEVQRIPGNNEVFFINNDRNFIRTNEPRTQFEIFDLETYQIIDSLANDDKISTGSIDISKNELYLISTIPWGFRIWNLQTKDILRTKVFPAEPNLINLTVDVVLFSCDENKFIGHLVKTYEDPLHPGDQNYYKVFGNYIVYDFNTMDSLYSFSNARGFVRSHSCKYFAVATGDPDLGVEVYDFNTKQLLHKLPINGPSLTGIEFSPDDKYLVTSNGPGTNALKSWSIETGTETHDYPHGSYTNFDISHDGKNIVSSTGRYLFFWYAKFNTLSVPIEGDDTIIIYPNPASGTATIQFEQTFPEITNINLNTINGQLIKPLFNGYLESGQQSIDINTGDLSSGTYIITVQNSHLSLFFKLIINN